jgi:hypothetical protein
LKKALAIILFFYLIINNSTAQQFAPTGAIWHYGVIKSPAAGNKDEYYLKFEAIKDTLVQGKVCRLVQIQSLGNSVNYNRKEIFYTDSAQVYHLINHSFYTLYNFAAKKGNSWTIRIPYEMYGYTVNPSDTTRIVTVDSVKQMVVNAQPLRALYVHSNINDWKFKNPIIEKIGSGYMFAGVWGLWDTDIPYLRCYQDKLLSYKSTSNIPCDSIIAAAVDAINTNNTISIYPNPTQADLTIKFDTAPIKQIKLSLYSMLGQEIKINYYLAENGIVLKRDNLKSGMYFLKVLGDDKMHTYKLFYVDMP